MNLVVTAKISNTPSSSDIAVAISAVFSLHYVAWLHYVTFVQKFYYFVNVIQVIIHSVPKTFICTFFVVLMFDTLQKMQLKEKRRSYLPLKFPDWERYKMFKEKALSILTEIQKKSHVKVIFITHPLLNTNTSAVRILYTYTQIQ